MKEKLIIEIDNDKLKYAVFQINEKGEYKLLTKKISNNAGIKKGKILDFDLSLKVITLLKMSLYIYLPFRIFYILILSHSGKDHFILSYLYHQNLFF